MRVLFCTSEIYPYVKTGGLGDVADALPRALKKAGVDVRLFLPGYESILSVLENPETLIKFPVYFGAADVSLLRARLPNGMISYILDAPSFWDRSGAYVDESGNDWPDNHNRFAALCRAAADLPNYERAWQADIIHGNDWQSGLIAPYIKNNPDRRARTILTIHNIAYQGLFPPSIMPSIGLPGSVYTMEGGEFYGKLGYLKAGLAYSDRITTVSPTYAAEIQTTDQGCGLQDFLATKSGILTGILNGIDTEVWDPRHDPHIAYPFDTRHPGHRAKNKQALLDAFSLPPSERPLFAVVSRLGYQKGFDMLLGSAETLIEGGGNLVLLGSGDRALEQAFTNLAAEYPDKVSVQIGYNEILAHQMQAGADVMVMPSRSEPCGLVQLYAMRYGALPLVHKTGGLADTVRDGETGFVFEGESAAALSQKIETVLETYQKPKAWKSMQDKAMKQDFSLDVSAQDYIRLYKELAA